MKKADAQAAVLGIAVASLLMWFANSNWDVIERSAIGQYILIVFFPAFLGLVPLTATQIDRALVVTLLVIGNGMLYGLISYGFRHLFNWASKC
jgi:apolipoprotein N-acyltransferase